MTMREGREVSREPLLERRSSPAEWQKDIIIGILVSFFEDEDRTSLGEYIQHVGFDMNSFSDPADLISAWLGHYRLKQGVYDVDRATNDLATFPPIAARIAELKAEKGEV
jgi:hypothetical protein